MASTDLSTSFRWSHSSGFSGDLRPDLLAIASLIQPGERVLDLGCGDGALLRYLQDQRRVVGRGIELLESHVLACVRLGVSVRQGNLQEGLRDYPDGVFDSVILSQTIPFLNDPSFIIKEMLRVGSQAIITVPNWGYWRCRLSLLLTGRIPQAPGLPLPWDAAPRARPLTIRDFEEFCHRQGLEIDTALYLKGDRPLAGGFVRDLRATIAVFVLKLSD
jgi:methionine biosynthesis protein MetW